MIDKNEIEKLRSYLPDYLISKGIDIRKPFNCLNPEHHDKTPSMSFYRERNTCHCFACGKNYDLFDLIGIEYNLNNYGEQADKARELYGGGHAEPRRQTQAKKTALKDNEDVDPSVYREQIKQAQEHLSETDYFTRRGLSEETARHFGCGFLKDWKNPKKPNAPASPRFIIPTSETSYLARETREDVKQYTKMNGGQKNMFNLKCLKESDAVFICEGEIDAMTFYQAGFSAVGLSSTSQIDRFVSYVEENPTKAVLVPCLDNDKTGREKTPALVEGLKKAGCDVFEIPSELDFVDRTADSEAKDPNAWFLKDGSAFTQACVKIIQAALLSAEERQQAQAEEQEALRQEYRQKNAVSSFLQGFNDLVNDTANDPVYSTGFYMLDNKLDGGFKPEQLVTIGAIPALGKTALCMQIMDGLARQGNDVLIFNLEMSKMELVSRSLSRHTLQVVREEPTLTQNDALSQNFIQEGRKRSMWTEIQKTVYSMAVEDYSAYAGRIFVFEYETRPTAQQIRAQIGEHIRLTGNRPAVLIDYLQMIAPSDPHLTDKQAIDETVLTLKQTARKFRIPVVLVSSFNRESYKAEVNMNAMKESGSIEYASDVAIGLQFKGAGGKDFDGKEAARKNPREVELHIMKARRSQNGEKVDFLFYPRNYFFVEA